MRIAASMKGVHYVLHAPQGDTYADLLFTMIERRGERPPVTYTTFPPPHTTHAQAAKPLKPLTPSGATHGNEDYH